MGDLTKGWIRLRDLHIPNAQLGAYDHEKGRSRPIVVHLGFWTDISQSSQSDRLEDTLDYAAAAQAVGNIAAGRHYNLVETLAEAIARELLETFAPLKVEVQVDKPGIFDPPQHTATASVCIVREPQQ